MTTRNTIQRNRALQILILLLVIAAGIVSRKYPWILPSSLGKYPGDALWALAAFVLWGLILPRATTMKIAGLAFLTSVLDEISQLYHAPWIDAIRSTSIGHLLLGFSFSWMDILAYATGVLAGIIIESMVRFSHKH
ncbi:MAG: DUF2809 domain-containing protein [Bacteroidota bacterium]